MLIYVVYLVLIALCTALQHAWPGWLLLWGRAPDLPLAVVVCAGLTGGPALGCYAGLCGGLLAGSAESSLLGAHFVSYMSVGTVVGSVKGRVFADRVLVAAMVVLCAAPAVDIVRLIIAPPATPGSWLLQTVIGAPYSALVTAPIYVLVRAIADTLLDRR